MTLLDSAKPYLPYAIPALAGVGVAFRTQIGNVWQECWQFINPWKSVTIDSLHPAFDSVIDDIYSLDCSKSHMLSFTDSFRFVPMYYTLLKKNHLGIKSFYVSKDTAKDSLTIKYTARLYTNKRNIKKLEKYLMTKKHMDYAVPYYFTAEWEQGFTMLRRHPQGFDKLVDADGIYKEVLDHVNWFFANKSYYLDHGFTYKNTTLIHSKPGYGKTRLVHAIASELRCHVVVLGSKFETWFSATAYCINKIHKDFPGEKIIVLCEEFDKIYAATKTAGVVNHHLLSFLDGIQTPENVYMLFLANEIDKIDDVVLRAGRVDKTYCLSACSKAQIIETYLTFTEGNAEQAEAFYESLGDTKDTCSFAEIKSMLISGIHKG